VLLQQKATFYQLAEGHSLPVIIEEHPKKRFDDGMNKEVGVDEVPLPKRTSSCGFVIANDEGEVRSRFCHAFRLVRLATC